MRKTIALWAGLALLAWMAPAGPAAAEVQTIEIDVAGYLCGL
jgi:hypothetical protein